MRTSALVLCICVTNAWANIWVILLLVPNILFSFDRPFSLLVCIEIKQWYSFVSYSVFFPLFTINNKTWYSLLFMYFHPSVYTGVFVYTSQYTWPIVKERWTRIYKLVLTMAQLKHLWVLIYFSSLLFTLFFACLLAYAFQMCFVGSGMSVTVTASANCRKCQLLHHLLSNTRQKYWCSPLPSSST